jgi:hypothetical protein
VPRNQRKLTDKRWWTLPAQLGAFLDKDAAEQGIDTLALVRAILLQYQEHRTMLVPRDGRGRRDRQMPPKGQSHMKLPNGERQGMQGMSDQP